MESIDIGSSIRKARLQRKMTQRQLADHVYVSNVSIGNYERNVRTPNLEILIQIAVALDMGIEELIGIKESESKLKDSCCISRIDIEKLKEEVIPLLQRLTEVFCMKEGIENNKKDLPIFCRGR